MMHPRDIPQPADDNKLAEGVSAAGIIHEFLKHIDRGEYTLQGWGNRLQTSFGCFLKQANHPLTRCNDPDASLGRACFRLACT